MFTRPYSIYIDKRPMRIAFLVDPESTSLETIDQIIAYNRSLWGGRFNPIILTDGHTIDDKWWHFLRDLDPDVIKPLLSLDIELIERIENFLSPLVIEQFREDQQSILRTRINTRNASAGIDLNSLNPAEFETWYQGVWRDDPMLGIFNLDEMDDDVGKHFILRNFGTYQLPKTISPETFVIPESLESVLSLGVVPPEVHEAFKKAGVPFSKEVFSKKSIQRPGSWAIIDQENKQIQYVEYRDHRLSVQPETRRFKDELNDIKNKVYVVTNRKSLATTLLELARTPNIVFRDQVCAIPDSERDIRYPLKDHFDVVVGDTLQDIVYFWNKPLLLPMLERGRLNQTWLPIVLAKAPDMEEALWAWIARAADLGSGMPRTVRFVSLSTETQELENIASRFQRKLRMDTVAKRFHEPQVPNFLQENTLSFQATGMDIHRVHSDKEILELIEPRGLVPRDVDGHWMADFHIEFTHGRYGHHNDVIKEPDESFLFWQFPNRNHLTRLMFDRPSRVRRNGFPSVMMRIGENVLCFTLEDAESVVVSLFRRNNYPVYAHRDPRTQLVTSPYNSVEVSDKGKYLRGVLELFGNLTFAIEILGNPYWRAMFDKLSKNTGAEHHAHKTIANKLKKQIEKSESLVDNPVAVESIAKLVVNEAKKLDLKQKEFPFDKFTQMAEDWWKKEMAHMSDFQDTSEMTMVDLGFGREDVKRKLSQLTQRNIIQIGVKPRCSNCGMVHWYHVDDIGQHVTCQGCRSQFPLHPELTWHYRLNGLIHAAHALHGTTPVILVLGQLFRDSRTSFLFSPNLKLLSIPQDESSERLDKVAEVDIACIQDGKFIIGEVKQSMDLFKPKDFDAMAEIAKKTKPDMVLFACIDEQEPKRRIAENIERIQNELIPLGIDVKWYKLEHVDYSLGV